MGVLCAFCLHDTRGQYLALGEFLLAGGYLQLVNTLCELPAYWRYCVCVSLCMAAAGPDGKFLCFFFLSFVGSRVFSVKLLRTRDVKEAKIGQEREQWNSKV